MPEIIRNLIISSVLFLLVCTATDAATTVTERTVNSNAVFAFVGVLLGSLITGVTSWLAARENRKLQWALAALDKRLEVHQEAYTEWKKIMGAVCGGEDIFNTVQKGERWWNNNCLYLDAASRRAFRDCLLLVHKYRDCLEETHHEQFRQDKPDVWERIMKPGKTLQAGVGLPGLGELELGLDAESEQP